MFHKLYLFVAVYGWFIEIDSGIGDDLIL